VEVLTEDYLSVYLPRTMERSPSRRGDGSLTMPRIYIETYGCQMNVSDSELMLGVLRREGLRAQPTMPPRPTSCW